MEKDAAAVAAAPPAPDADTLIRSLELPAMPANANRVSMAVANPYTTAHTLAALVESDQGMAVHLLKTVNSSLYGLSTKVANITHAVSVMGFSMVRDLVVSFSMRYLFKKFGPVERAMWNHAHACALMTRRLATKFAPESSDLAFLAGQLHDVGEVLLRQMDPYPMARDAKRSAAQCADLEQMRFGYHHGHFGAALIRHWRLPEVVALAAEHHIRPVLTELVDKNAARLVACVALADEIAHAAESGDSFNVDPVEALAVLGVPLSDFQTVANEALQQLAAEAPELRLKAV